MVITFGQSRSLPEQDPATKGSQAPDTWQVTLAVPPYVQLPAHTDPTEVPAQLPGHTPKASNAVGTDEQFVGGPARQQAIAAMLDYSHEQHTLGQWPWAACLHHTHGRCYTHSLP